MIPLEKSRPKVAEATRSARAFSNGMTSSFFFGKLQVMAFVHLIRSRFRIVGYLLDFLWNNKMWWMIPMVLLLFAFFLVIVLGHSTPLGPFIYTLF